MDNVTLNRTKPRCLCEHTYGEHAWGSAFCSKCDCKKYVMGSCECKHAWEVHSITADPGLVWCPICGQTCAHWEVMIPATQSTQPEPSRRLGEQLDTCKHCVYTTNWENGCHMLVHAPDCPTKIRLDLIEKEANLLDNIEKTRETGDIVDAAKEAKQRALNWKQQLEKEEKEAPQCKCGHSWTDHYDEGDKLPCAMCWEAIDSKTWETTCKDYTPATPESDGMSDIVSDDPAVVNKAVSQQLADKQVHPNGRAMTIDEINAKIDEYKQRMDAQTASGAGTTGVRQPIGQNYTSDDWRKAYDGYSGTGTALFPKCSHKPTHVINGKNWHVYAGTKLDCNDSVLDYDIVLNVSNGYETIPKHVIPFRWAENYQVCKTKEIMLDWPDGGIPVIPPRFWVDLVKHLKKTNGKMITFCIGGHGRTGTAIAALLIACGWNATAAKQWIWRYYCKEAIETQIQEKYLDKLEQDLAERPKKKKKAKQAVN